MNVYLAGPLFGLAEQSFNRQLATALRRLPELAIILPQERATELLKKADGKQLVFAGSDPGQSGND